MDRCFLDQWLSYRISAGNGAFLMYSSVSLLQTFHPSSNRFSANDFCTALVVIADVIFLVYSCSHISEMSCCLHVFCVISLCRSLQVFCRFFAGRLQTFQTFRKLVVTWVCNGLTIWSCTFLMHGFSSLPLQRIFFISAKSLTETARSKVFGVGSVCKHWGQNKLIPRPHLGGHAIAA